MAAPVGSRRLTQEPERPETRFGVAEAPQAAFDHGRPDVEKARVEAVLVRARDAGLLDQKSTRISGRVSPELVAQAKIRSGLTSDSELIEFALANIALDDPFVEVFRSLEGAIDLDIPLGY